MKIMYLWHVPGGIIGLIVLVMHFMGVSGVKIRKVRNEFAILIFGLVAFFLSFDYESLLNYINILVLPITIFYLIKSTPKFLMNLLNAIRDVFYYLLLISFPLFILYQMGVDIINLGSTSYLLYSGTNHLFFFYQPEYGIRFCAMFCEPGHLGMILAMLLYALNFDLKNKKNIYLFVCMLFTLSLAAYFLTLIGYLGARFSQGKIRLSTFLSSVIIIAAFFFIFSNISYTKVFILERLLYDSNTASIAGDNRMGWEAQQFYSTISKHDFMYGIGADGVDKFNIAGTGLKIHIIHYGLISVISIFVYYLFLLFAQKVTMDSVVFFVIFMLSFYQRSYALWACELVLFVCFIIKANQKDEKFLNYHTKQK